jgi:holo-[acyl-carrier protein] synthase
MDTPSPHPDSDSILFAGPTGGMIVGLGTDLVHLPRIEGLYQKYGTRFLDRVLTFHEKQYCMTPVSLKVKVARIGGRIAAKEAVVKALGIGIANLGNPQGTLWTHIELHREERQAPKIKLYKKAAEVAERIGIEDWLISLTHDGDYAMAIAYGMKKPSSQAGPAISF